MLLKIFNVVIIFCNFYATQGEVLDTYCSINGKHPLHKISEKFLSLSIDPADLLAGINLGDTALSLIQNLSPAYIRIAGPSTKYVKYIDNEFYIEDDLSDGGNNDIIVTPFMWFGVNEWLKQANLTPVFGISDDETNDGGLWDPESTIPLLEISDRLNVSCYWMLGFDSSKKNATQYKEDLHTFHHVLSAFPEHNKTWKIVASDISSFSMDHTQNILQDLKDIVTAVTWETNTTQESFPEKNVPLKLVNSQNQPPVKIWTSCPKSSQPTSFSSALLWANQVGDAAKLGYDVVFRQPNKHELFSDTPVYWFSLLHKRLMGNKVLEVEPLSQLSNCSIFAHCARNQNESEQETGITVMIVNNNSDSYNVKVRLTQFPLNKFMEIESYILTAPEENSTDIFLNGERLTPESLSNENSLQPEIMVVKLKTHVSFHIPPMSIGFFVLPKAMAPGCSREEYKNILNLDKIKDKSVSDSEEDLTVQPRDSFKKHLDSEILTKKMKNDKFSEGNLELNLNDSKQQMKLQSEGSETDLSSGKYDLEEDRSNKKSIQEMMNGGEDLGKNIFGKTNQGDGGSDCGYVDLKEQTKRILRERARATALKQNVILTDDELDLIMEAIRRKYARYVHSKIQQHETSNNHDINSEHLEESAYQEDLSSQHLKPIKTNGGRSRKVRDVNTRLLNLRSKIEEKRQRMEERMSDVVGNAQIFKQNIKDKIYKLRHNDRRFKRGINMELLKIKDEEQQKMEKESLNKKYKTFFKNREVKKATFRKPEQTSDELLYELEEHSSEKNVPKTDIFAEFFNPQQSEEESREIPKPKKISLFDKKLKFKGFTTAKPKKFNFGKKESEEENESGTSLKNSDEFNDFQEHLPCMYEHFESRNKKPKEELVGQIQKKSKKLKIGKSKMNKSTESPPDSMEYLRKKRSHIDISKGLKELGVADSNGFKSKIFSKLIGNNNTSKIALLPEDCDEKKMSIDKPNENLKLGGTTLSLDKLSKLKLDPLNSMINIDNLDDLITETALVLKDVISISTAIAEAKLDKFQHKLNKKQKRRRRSINDEFREKLMPAHKVHIKKQLKDSKEVEDTEDRGLKMEMLESKKGKDKKEFSRVLSGDNKFEKEKRKEVYGKLKSLKEKLTNKKKDMDKSLVNQMKLKKKLEEGERSLLKEISKNRNEMRTRKANMKKFKINSRIAAPVMEENEKNSSPAPIVKRSLFEQKYGRFGYYKPLTTDLKVWQPVDILTLKRDTNIFSSPVLRPIADLHLIQNVLAPNKYLNFRRKRHTLEDNLNSLDDRDLYLNDIEKNAISTVPTIKEDENSYNNFIQDIHKGEKHSAALKPNLHDLIPEMAAELVIKQIKAASGDNKEAKNVKEISESNFIVDNRVSDNIQRIPTRHEQSLIDNLINKMSGLFTSIGGAFGKYIKS